MWDDVLMPEACLLQGLRLHETCRLYLARVGSSYCEIAICSLDALKTLLELRLHAVQRATGSGWKWSERSLAVFP